MKKTFPEVMMSLSGRSDLDPGTLVTIGTAATYIKGAYDMLKSVDGDSLSPTRRSDLESARDSVRDAVISALSLITNDNVPDNINDLIEASE